MWTHFWDMHSGGGTKVLRMPDGSFTEGSRFSQEGQPVNHIYIQAPEDEAKVIFYNRFGHNPERVSCTCCGEDYSISSNEDLAQLTGYHRHCQWLSVEGEAGGGQYIESQSEDLRKYVTDGDDEQVWQAYLDSRGSAAKYQTLEQYMNEPEVLFIPATHIKPEERRGSVPEQGYVWVG
jgi:hypothetical protein